MSYQPLPIQNEDAAASSGEAGLPVLGVRQDSDSSPVSANGDFHQLIFDEVGRLKVAAQPASMASVTANLSAVGNALTLDTRRVSNIVFHLKNTGTAAMSAGTFQFEASIDSTNGTDGTWFGFQAVQSASNTIGTSVAITSLAANTGSTSSWEASVNGYAWIRIRCSIATTVSSIGTWTVQPGSYATEPIPAAQASAAQPVTVSSGTVTTVSTLSGGGIAHGTADSTSNPVKVGGKAHTSNPTAAADSSRSNFITDKLGKQVIVGSIREMKVQQITTITASTAETTILTAVASTFLDLYGLIIANTSTTDTTVAIKDATAGTTRLVVAVKAGETYNLLLPESAALNQAVVNTNWTATSTASVSSLVITALAIRNL